MESAQHAKKSAAVVLLFWGGVIFSEAVPVGTIGPLGPLKRAIETPKRTDGVDTQREQIKLGRMCNRNRHWADLLVSGKEAKTFNVARLAWPMEVAQLALTTTLTSTC